MDKENWSITQIDDLAGVNRMGLTGWGQPDLSINIEKYNIYE
jgi:hypothetical protein